MERVQCEQRGHNHAAPDCAGDLIQEQKKKNCVGDVEQNADEMVHRGVLAEELAIEHVREPGERVPIAGVASGEGPFDVFPFQAALNVRVGGDVIRIVVIDKVVAKSVEVNREGDKRKQQAEQGDGTELFGPGWRRRRLRSGLDRFWFFVAFGHGRVSLMSMRQSMEALKRELFKRAAKGKWIEKADENEED